MASKRYVALLRGINVGGNNKIPMADLREVFSTAGHADVRSYIQSGNVVFASADPAADLEASLEAAIAERFDLTIAVVVIPHATLRRVVEQAPGGFGKRPDAYHSDVIFLKKPLTPAAALKVVQLRDGVDEVWAENGVLYFARLSEKRTQSKLSKIVGTPSYRQMTIRNWNAATKLLALLEEA